MHRRGQDTNGLERNRTWHSGLMNAHAARGVWKGGKICKSLHFSRHSGMHARFFGVERFSMVTGHLHRPNGSLQWGGKNLFDQSRAKLGCFYSLLNIVIILSIQSGPPIIILKTNGSSYTVQRKKFNDELRSNV